jgi:fructokinase
MAFRIVAVGEILWDLLPQGRQLGGAPANFALQAKALGADARLITRIGPDALGRDALEQVTERGLPGELIQRDAAAPTGTVSVEFQSSGAHAFTIHEHVAWDLLEATPAALAEMGQADAVCFGTLGQRCPTARAACQRLVAASSDSALRVFDVNLRQHFYSIELIRASLELANVFKVNDDELVVLAGPLGLHGDPAEQVAQLVDHYDLDLVALTRGQHGSLLTSPAGVSEHAGVAAKPFRDSIGAGDAFTAALTIGLLAEWPLDEINHRANQVAAEVCQHAGALAPISAELRNKFSV